MIIKINDIIFDTVYSVDNTYFCFINRINEINSHIFVNDTYNNFWSPYSGKVIELSNIPEIEYVFVNSSYNKNINNDSITYILTTQKKDGYIELEFINIVDGSTIKLYINSLQILENYNLKQIQYKYTQTIDLHDYLFNSHYWTLKFVFINNNFDDSLENKTKLYLFNKTYVLENKKHLQNLQITNDPTDFTSDINYNINIEYYPTYYNSIFDLQKISLFQGNIVYESVDFSNEKNIFIGVNSGQNNEKGNENICIGFDTCKNSTDSQQNLIIGNHCLVNSNNSDNNINIGYNSSYNSKSSNANIIMGRYSAHNICNSQNNIIIGNSSSYNISECNNNIILGNNSAYNIGLHDLQNIVTFVPSSDMTNSIITISLKNTIIYDSLDFDINSNIICDCRIMDSFTVTYLQNNITKKFTIPEDYTNDNPYYNLKLDYNLQII